MAEPDRPTPPAGFRWNWPEFLFAVVANAAGTMLALGITALYASAVGFLQVTQRQFLLGLVLPFIAAIATISVAFANWNRIRKEYEQKLADMEYDGIPQRPRDHDNS